jgi:hypothetical protein
MVPGTIQLKPDLPTKTTRLPTPMQLLQLVRSGRHQTRLPLTTTITTFTHGDKLFFLPQLREYSNSNSMPVRSFAQVSTRALWDGISLAMTKNS